MATGKQFFSDGGRFKEILQLYESHRIGKLLNIEYSNYKISNSNSMLSTFLSICQNLFLSF